MYSIQLKQLSRTIIDILPKDSLLLQMESIKIKQKKLKRLKSGDILYLGKTLPLFYITQNGKYISSVEIGYLQQQSAIRLTDTPKDQDNIEDIGKKWDILDIHIAIVPMSIEELSSGKIVTFGFDIYKDISLIKEGKRVATVSLVGYGNGYGLQIVERIKD